MEVNDKQELLLIELIKKNKINSHFIQKFRKEYLIHLLKQRQSHNQQKHFGDNAEIIQDFKEIAKVRKLKINTQKNNNNQVQSKSEVVLPQSNRNINQKSKMVQDKNIIFKTHQNLIKSQNGIKQISLNYQNHATTQSRNDYFKYKATKHEYVCNKNSNNQIIIYKEPLNMFKVSLEKHSFLSYINHKDNYRSLKKKIAINLKNIQFNQENVFKFSKKSSKTKQKLNHFPLINAQQTKYEWNLRDRSFINNDNKRKSHKSQASQKLIHVNSLLCLKQ